MKKKSFSAGAVISMLLPVFVFPGCTESHEPESEEGQSFSVRIDEVTMTGVRASVEESSGGLTYYVSVDNKEDFDEKYADNQEAYFKMKMDFIKVMAGVYSQSVPEYLETVLKTGKTEFYEEDLYYDTGYYLCVFGLDNTGNVTTALHKTEFRTKTFEASSDCQFIIQKSEITASSIRVVVGASDPEVRYYVSYMPEEDYLDYGTAEEAASDIIFSAELFDDVDWSDPSNTETDRCEKEFTGLESATDYVIFAFGVSETGDLTTEVYTAEFSTL